jgi:hypothetical protein
MVRRRDAILVLILVSLTWGTAACSSTGPDLDTVGTVTFHNVEGGCWTIETEEDGYEPINLAEEFKVDGLRVNFEANFRDDMASVCMVGRLIELLEIETIQ